MTTGIDENFESLLKPEDPEARVNEVFDIQNNWMEALIACQIPDKTYSDCKACKNPRCVYAWSKLQTLWPEIGDWPPKPVKEYEKCKQNTATPSNAAAGKLDL